VKKIGCLIVIILVCVGVYYFMSAEGMTEEQMVQFVGEKAHRGWQETSRMAEQARKGWNEVPGDANTKPAVP
jgi:hypothetical protein